MQDTKRLSGLDAQHAKAKAAGTLGRIDTPRRANCIPGPTPERRIDALERRVAKLEAANAFDRMAEAAQAPALPPPGR